MLCYYTLFNISFPDIKKCTFCQIHASISSRDVIAQKEIQDKQPANPAQHDFHFTKGDVRFKLLGLSATNRTGILHGLGFIFGRLLDDMKSQI